MGELQNNHLLPHILLKLSPDVFFHPLWLYYIPRSPADSSEIIDELQPTIQGLLKYGDYRNAAQLLLVCAVLQKRSGDPLAASGTIQKVWNIGLSQRMPEIASWAAWGGCTICVQLGEFSQAAEYLERLQRRLDKGEEWVLLSTLETIKNSLLDYPGEQGNMPDILSWMQSWGEPSYKITFQANSNGDTQPDSLFHTSGQVLPRFSKAWWRALMHIITKYLAGEQPVWMESNGSITSKIDPGYQETAPPPKYVPISSLADEKEASLLAGELPAPEPKEERSLKARNRLSLKFYCLGSFRLYQNDEWVYRWVSRKALSVLKHLVLYHPSPSFKRCID
jgi:hypothetical protein